jgi:hypothetical protein
LHEDKEHLILSVGTGKKQFQWDSRSAKEDSGEKAAKTHKVKKRKGLKVKPSHPHTCPVKLLLQRHPWFSDTSAIKPHPV